MKFPRAQTSSGTDRSIESSRNSRAWQSNRTNEFGAIPAGASRYAAAPRRSRRATISKIGGAGLAVTLSILFWSIFYQGLPWSLDGFASKMDMEGPVSNIGDRVIKVLMILISLMVIAKGWSVTRSLAKAGNLGAAAILVLVPLSALWSLDPGATLLRFSSLAAIVLVCFAISVAGWQRLRFQQLTIPPLLFVLAGSLVVGAIYPDKITEIGDDISQRNAWHGITHGKNEFGMFASMGSIVFANLCLGTGRRKFWAFAGAGISLACLILSRSNTSLIATIVGIFAMVMAMRVPVIRERFSPHVMIGLVCLILVYEMAIQNIIPGVNVLLGPIMGLTGKDATFSARTIIWNVIKQHMGGAPYLGTGYGAYWTGPFESSPSYIFVQMNFFYPTESHNGYLEIMNDMGYVGLICLLLFLFYYLKLGIALMRFDRSQASLYLALLLQEMVINMSESEWFSRTMTFSILLLATACMSRSLLEGRRQALLSGLSAR